MPYTPLQRTFSPLLERAHNNEQWVLRDLKAGVGVYWKVGWKKHTLEEMSHVIFNLVFLHKVWWEFQKKNTRQIFCQKNIFLTIYTRQSGCYVNDESPVSTLTVSHSNGYQIWSLDIDALEWSLLQVSKAMVPHFVM